jgi:hypothetical protein
MRRRLYFVLPDKKLAQDIERELLLRLVNTDQIGFMAQSDNDLGDLLRPGAMQWSDLRHGIKVGLLAEGLTGAVIGLLLSLYAGLQTELSIILLMAVGGAVFGVWMQSMTVRVPNRRLQTLQQNIRNGQILLMIDVTQEQVEAVTQLVGRWHPAAATNAAREAPFPAQKAA